MEAPAPDDDVTAEPKIDCPDDTNGEDVVATVLEPNMDLLGEGDDENGDCPNVF